MVRKFPLFKNLFSFNNVLSILSLFSIFTLSYILKLKDLKNFSNKENILSCYDCFWYARIAKDILNDSYTRIDYLRNVPDLGVNPKFPYLISFFTAYFSKFTGIDLNNLFLFLPPILSVFFIIPLFFWTKRFAPLHVFISGAMVGVFNLIYYERTTLGRFDTDFLILFFVFFLIFLITLTSESTGKKSYIYLILTGIVFNIFMWWYYKPLFSILFTFSLVSGLILFGKNSKKEVLIKTGIFILLINPMTIFDGLNIFNYIHNYFYKKNESILPLNITVSIAELQAINFKQFVYFTVDNYISAVLSILGLILLFIKRFKYMIIALPIMLIGLVSFKSGLRFVMYFSPFLGMGLGYLFYLLFEFISVRYRKYKKPIFVFGIFFVAFLSFPAKRLYFISAPLLSNNLFNSFKHIGEITEKNAYIWTWWDFGDPIEFVSNRGTFVDNQSFNAYKLFFISHFFGLKDEEKARNTIAFATNNLFKDYKNINNLDKLKEKIYSYNENLYHPVYISITQKEFTNKYMLVIGSYSKENKNVPVSSFLLKCKTEKDFYDCFFFKMDKKTNFIEWKKQNLQEKNPFYKIVLLDESKLKIKEVLFENKDEKSKKILEILKKDDRNVYFSIIHKDFENTIINRMFFYRDDFKNFKLVYDNFPYLVLYKAF